ncbi:hypothetical protein BDZ94DRAFT_1191837 [Collybia nuda]|uniref:Tyrosinase copper-binding domain-containing protein n=1 Tax=Collybia nuda TaxID=64659 RepID=A0A9P6CJ62_9AGAR|nr:hypothetical protein BDZ94DRAFT_1191837 [Collybia nuda]
MPTTFLARLYADPSPIMITFLYPARPRSDVGFESQAFSIEEIKKFVLDGQKESLGDLREDEKPVMIPLVASFKAAFLVLFTVACILVQSGRMSNRVLRCYEPLERREWRNLTSYQQRQYTDAVKCMQCLPATTSFKAVNTRFDDFQALHINLAPEIHLVGHFLPWHRRFIATFEKALRRECGYEGALPYWDWTLDYGRNKSITTSPIFDPLTGFGGFPKGGGCVTDGPFASYNLSFGPGPVINNHCLTRSYNKTLAPYLTPAQVANTTKQPTFELFRIELEGRPFTETIKIHDAGHRIVGGEMQDDSSSPGDPVFYLHHANLDRIWWIWQKADAIRRVYEISGRSTVDPPYRNVTLDFRLKMGTLAELVPIRDVMDTSRAPLCYTYI